MAFPVGRLRDAGEFENGRNDVDDVSGRVAEFTVSGDASGPGGDEGRADPAFVHPGLMTAVRGVGGAGEAGPEAEVGCGAAHGGLLIVAAVAYHNLGAGAVVGGEEDKGVLVGAHGLELGDDTTDLLVHAVDHRGVDGHLRGLEAALLGGERVPRQRAVHLVRTELGDRIREGVGRADFTFEGRERRVRETEFPLAGMARDAQGFPAGEILVAILGDVFGQGVEREVWGDERDVVEERLVLVVSRMVLEAVDGVVGRGDGRVIAFLVGRYLHRDVVDRVTLGAEEVALVAHVERAVEAAGEDRSVDMPLAAVVIAIACGLQVIGKQAGPGLADTLAAAADTRERVAVNLLRVVTREQRGAGRPAARGVIELREAHALVGEPVEVRRGDLAAVAAEVGVAEVVGEDEYDVRTRGRGGEGRQGGEQ